MKSLLLLFVVLFVSKVWADDSEESYVVDLTLANFEDLRAPVVFVEFYDPSCEDCQVLESTWKQLSRTLNGKVQVARVNSVDETVFSGIMNINSFPTLLLFHKELNKVYKYAGERSETSMAEFALNGYIESNVESFPFESSQLALNKYIDSGLYKLNQDKEKLKRTENEEKKINSLNITSLDINNFDELVKDGEWFVTFYAPWCGFCQTMMPMIANLAETLRDRGHSVTVAKINGDEQVQLVKRFKLTWYPTLYYIHNGQMWKYKELPDDEKMLSFVLGGYRNVNSTQVPLPRTLSDTAMEKYEMLKRDYDSMMKTQHKYVLIVVLGISVIVGFLLKLVMVACCCRGSKIHRSKRAQESKKNK